MSTMKALTDEYRIESVVIRGVTYEFKELSAGDYDAIIKVAQGPEGDAEMGVVLRMMAVKSLVSPKMTADELNSKPLPVFSKLVSTVNRMHFDPLPDEVGETKPPNE